MKPDKSANFGRSPIRWAAALSTDRSFKRFNEERPAIDGVAKVDPSTDKRMDESDNCARGERVMDRTQLTQVIKACTKDTIDMNRK